MIALLFLIVYMHASYINDCQVIWWIIHSTDCSKSLTHSRAKQVTVFMSESLSHSLQWFIQKCWFVDEFTSDCLYEWVIEPFIQNSKKQKKSGCLYEWVNESFIQWFVPKCWFIQVHSKVAIFTSELIQPVYSKTLFRNKISDCLYELNESFSQLIHLKPHN